MAASSDPGAQLLLFFTGRGRIVNLASLRLHWTACPNNPCSLAAGQEIALGEMRAAQGDEFPLR